MIPGFGVQKRGMKVRERVYRLFSLHLVSFLGLLRNDGTWYMIRDQMVKSLNSRSLTLGHITLNDTDTDTHHQD